MRKRHDMMAEFRNVLMIAYYFPPMGGAGVQRALKFVKYLPDFNWQPHVLTTQPLKSGLRDESLLREIDHATPVTRTAALLPPHRLPWRLRNFISRWFLVVDEQIGWMPFAVSTGRKVIAANDIQAIYSTSAPYTDHLIAYQLHRQTMVPWVADFRDPWIGNFSLRFATRWHKSIIQQLERQIVQAADHIIVASPPIGESFCKRIPGINPTKITWLPNGFDRQDFTDIKPKNRENDVFHLIYTGSFYNQLLTAGPILHSIHSLVNEGRIPRKRLRVQFVGEVGKSTHKWIHELELEDIVETPGYVPHDQSIAYLLSADALLLVIGEFPGSSEIYAGKTFEYLAANKPILCLASEGVSSDLIHRTKTGIVAPPNDNLQIKENLVRLYREWEKGELKVSPDMGLINTFERRKLTGQLADILDEIHK